MATKSPEQIAEEAKQRRATRALNKSAGGDSDLIPITEAATLGQAEPFTIGDVKPLRLNLCALPGGAAKKLYNRIFEVWPYVFVTAAVGDRQGKGIDAEKCLAFHAQTLLSKFQEADTEDEEREEFDPISEIEQFTFALFNFPSEGGTRHVIDEITDTLWPLAEGHNDGLTREALPQLLVDTLKPRQYADLLRAMLRACTGSDTPYASDAYDIFTQP